MGKKRKSEYELETDEQFGIMSSEKSINRLKAEKRRKEYPTELEVHSDNISILETEVKALKIEVKRILEHLGME